MSLAEIAVRLLAATLCGIVIGLNRDARGKPAGLRTFSLVSIGTALLTLIVLLRMSNDAASLSRVVQGMVTGIGFLGAGMIFRHSSGKRVAGLTTAAAIWLAAGLGIACGAGLYALAGIAIVLTLGVLVLGGSVERLFEKLLGRDRPPLDHDRTGEEEGSGRKPPGSTRS